MTKREQFWWDLIGTAPDPELTGFLLHELGAAGFDWSNPEELHSYYHGTAAEKDRFAAAAKSLGFRVLHTERLPITDWSAVAEYDWRSITVGEVLLHPLTEPEDGRPLAAPGPLEFFIHPASGFGTGHHITTRATLDLLLTLKGEVIDSVLDAGTGSGVLAMVACRIFVGATAKGIDQDETALSYARRNLFYNGFENRIALSTDPIERIKGTFGLILSNIYTEYHQQNEKVYYRLLRPGGALILSGIALETRSALEGIFSERWSTVRSREDGRWVTSLLRRR